MPSPLEEAKAHVASAEKAMKTSLLKWSPDYLSASMEYAQAATKFRAAGQLPEAIQCNVISGELKEKQNDPFGAGRAYEAAGNLCTEDAAKAEEYWARASSCFRACGKGDVAVKMLMKLAELREKRGDVSGAVAAFEDSVEIYEDNDNFHQLGDVLKSYIGLLARQKDWETLIPVVDKNIVNLKRLKQTSFVHKDLLGKVVVFLHLDDNVRAEAVVNEGMDVDGWLGSREFGVASELVTAFQQMDPEAAQKILKDQVFNFLQIDLARLAKTLKISGTYAASGQAGSSGAGAPQKTQNELLAESLM